MKFLLGQDLSSCHVNYDCSLEKELFDSSIAVGDAERLIETAGTIVDLLEKNCPQFSFAKFFLTMNGMSAAIL